MTCEPLRNICVTDDHGYICLCSNHQLKFSSLVTYYRICDESIATAKTAYTSGSTTLCVEFVVAGQYLSILFCKSLRINNITITVMITPLGYLHTFFARFLFSIGRNANPSG